MTRRKQKKGRFRVRDRWTNQTEIGRRLGISSIKVGKLLEENGLRIGKKATEKAIDDGFAIRTPLKDGTEFYMWDLQKVIALLSEENRPLSRLELLTNTAIKKANMIRHEYERGNDKIASLLSDFFWEDIVESSNPKPLSKEERQHIERVLRERGLF